MSHITTNDISDAVGIARSTVREWTRQYDIPHHRKKGKIVFSDEAQAIFESILQLKEKDAGMATIRRSIGSSSFSPHQEHGDAMTATSAPQPNHGDDMSTVIETSIERAISRNNDLAEKYARACHEIGKLENEVFHLKERLALLPSPTEVIKLESSFEASQAKIEALEKKNNSLPSQEEYEALKVKYEVIEEENQQLRSGWWYRLSNAFKMK